MLYQLHIFTHMTNIMAQEATLMPRFFISYSSNKKVLRNGTSGIYVYGTEGLYHNRYLKNINFLQR
jgi:hypothetical protein